MNIRRIFAIIIISILLLTAVNSVQDEKHKKKNLEIPFESENADDTRVPVSDTITRSRAQDENLSEWKDSFIDENKLWFLDDTIVTNNRLALTSSAGVYPTSGYAISEVIEPNGDGNWNRFHANSTANLFKRRISIDNSNNVNALSGYQVSIIVDTKALIDAGKMRSDCGDIRFYDGSGVGLPYWIESGINTNKTEIWVNVTSIPASTTSYIFMVYGNPTWVSQSSGTATFNFFDSFEDPSGYSNYWTTGGGNPNVVYSRSNTQTYDGSYALKAAMYNLCICSLYHVYPTAQTNKVITVHMYDDTSMSPGDNGPVAISGGKAGDNMRIKTNPSIYRYEYYDGSWHLDSSGPPRSTGWHEFNIILSSSSVALYLDGVEMGSRSVTDYTGVSMAYNAAWLASITHYYDAYFVREYSSPEPSVTVEAEEFHDALEVTYKILNATTNTEILTVQDGQDISVISEKSIKLKAEFTSNGDGSILLNEWGVDWNTVPEFEEISPVSGTEVYRNDSITVKINVFDVEELEPNLLLEIKYKPPSGTLWRTEYLDAPYYDTDHWEVTFSPPKTAETGLYTFRLTCSDSHLDSIEIDTYQILVKNNKPGAPTVSILPNAPRTGSDLQVELAGIYDLETGSDNLEFWFHWYKNDELRDEFDNFTKISNSLTRKNDSWRCEVYVFDGEDTGAPGDAEILIGNSKPVIAGQFPGIKFNEDTVFTQENILMSVFSDPDDADTLYYYASDQDKLVVEIFQSNGTIKLIPEENWFGIEEITFFGNDSSAHVEITVLVKVEAQNDLPEIIQIGSQLISDEYPELEFMVKQDEELKLKIKAKDIDGDDKRDMIEYIQNITETENFYFDDDGKELVFKPGNVDVGWHYIEIKISDNNETPLEYIPYKLKIYVINENDPPTVEITYPAGSPEISESDKISFSCKADDIDYLIPNPTEKLTYRWYARVPEILELGTGPELVDPKLPTGSYTITVEVKDSSNATATDSILIKVLRDESDTSQFFSANSYLWLIVVLVIVIIGVIVAIFFIARNKRKKTEALQPDVVHTPSAGEPLTSPYTGAPLGAQAGPEILFSTAAEPAGAQAAAQLQQTVSQPAAVTTYSLSADTQDAPDIELSLQEKLKLLEERLLKGEIDQELYEKLKAKFEMEASAYQPLPAPMLPPTTVEGAKAPGGVVPQVAVEPPAQVEPAPQEQVQAAAVPQADPQPTPPMEAQNLCTTCGQALSYIEQFNSYYCYSCEKYQ